MRALSQTKRKTTSQLHNLSRSLAVLFLLVIVCVVGMMYNRTVDLDRADSTFKIIQRVEEMQLEEREKIQMMHKEKRSKDREKAQIFHTKTEEKLTLLKDRVATLEMLLASVQNAKSASVAPPVSLSPPVTPSPTTASTRSDAKTIGDITQVHPISGMGWIGTDPAKIKKSFSSLKTCQLKFSGFPLSSSKTIQFIGSNKESGFSSSIFVCNTFFCSGVNGGKNGHEGTITNMHGYMAALGNPTKNEIMMDVGSNLGFYSLLDSKFGYRTMTFDPSTSCLYSTQGMAKINQLSDKIVLNNVGAGYEPLNLQNSNSGCHVNNHPTTTGGSGVKVLVRKLDELVTDMDGSNLLTDDRVVRLLKIDVEGGETKIVQGMNNLMQSGKVLNLIVELTPIHWNQAGLEKFDPTAAEHFAEMTTKHGYDAYMLYIQKPRHPPPSLSHIVSRVTEDHPINTYMKENNVDVEKYGIKIKNTGCEGSPFWKIHDMKKYILDYCVDWVGTAYPPSKGSCGNIWFTKSSSWTMDLVFDLNI